MWFVDYSCMEYTIGAIAYSTGKDNKVVFYTKYYAFMWEDLPYVSNVHSYTIKDFCVM